MTYDAVGRLTKQSAGNVVTRSMAYDVHGWLKTIATDIKKSPAIIDTTTIIFRGATSTAFDGLILPPGTIKLPLNGFTEELMYEKGKTPRYNGNISSHIFPEGRYDYTYDAYNRLTGASYTDTSNKSRNYSTTYSYSADSKISSLLRSGITDRVGTQDVYGQHSDIYFNYTGSKLTWVANGATGTGYEGRTGLPMCDPWEWNMGYDANGNLSYDESHNITSISYNHLNQPTSICFADGSEIENRYTSGGVKWQSTYTLPDGTQSVTKYLGNAIVRDGKFNLLRTPWGYLDGNGASHYYVTDYQGNVTHTVNDNAEIEQSVNYYPDGEPWVEPTGKNPFLFGGKERITFGGLRQYDFGARMLNASVGAWWQVDPMCEKYYPMSPYCSMGANPVMYTDPTGCKIIGATKIDAEIFRDDIYKILRDDKFEKVRSLISVKGDKFKQISQNDLAAALNGIDSDDELAFISMVANTINSKDKHYVQYISEGDEITSIGFSALEKHLHQKFDDSVVKHLKLQKQSDMGEYYNYFLGETVIALGSGGLNVPIKKGSYSFIQLNNSERVTNSIHEVFGHGIPSAKGMSDYLNNQNAIRADNLARRLLQIQTRGWNSHYTGEDMGNPNLLPIIH